MPRMRKSRMRNGKSSFVNILGELGRQVAHERDWVQERGGKKIDRWISLQKKDATQT